MIFYGKKRVDNIYFGNIELKNVFNSGNAVWKPTFEADEEEQFIPDECHPTDSFFTQYYDFIGYLRVEPARYDAVRVHDEGTIQPYSPMLEIRRPFPLFGGVRDYAAHLDDFRLTQDREYIYDYSWSYDTDFKYDVSLLNCAYGEYRKEGDYDINTLIGMQECCAGVEGIFANGVWKSWTISKTNGKWDNSNKLLSEIYFGDYTGLMYVGQYAFNGSVNLRNIRLPWNCFVIMDHAFAGCSSLKIADLRNCYYMDDIQEYAFANCTSLEKIVLPRVTQLRYDMLKGCSSLKKIVLLAEEPPLVYNDDDDSERLSRFLDIPDDVEICVPPQSVDKYNNAPRWSSYAVRSYKDYDFDWQYVP